MYFLGFNYEKLVKAFGENTVDYYYSLYTRQILEVSLSVLKKNNIFELKNKTINLGTLVDDYTKTKNAWDLLKPDRLQFFEEVEDKVKKLYNDYSFKIIDIKYKDIYDSNEFCWHVFFVATNLDYSFKNILQGYINETLANLNLLYQNPQYIIEEYCGSNEEILNSEI